MDAAEQFIADTRALLELVGVRQYELARRLGISAKHLNFLLNGKVRMTLDHAEAIASALGCDLEVRFVLRHATETPSGAEP